MPAAQFVHFVPCRLVHIQLSTAQSLVVRHGTEMRTTGHAGHLSPPLSLRERQALCRRKCEPTGKNRLEMDENMILANYIQSESNIDQTNIVVNMCVFGYIAMEKGSFSPQLGVHLCLQMSWKGIRSNYLQTRLQVW